MASLNRRATLRRDKQIQEDQLIYVVNKILKTKNDADVESAAKLIDRTNFDEALRGYLTSPDSERELLEIWVACVFDLKGHLQTHLKGETNYQQCNAEQKNKYEKAIRDAKLLERFRTDFLYMIRYELNRFTKSEVFQQRITSNKHRMWNSWPDHLKKEKILDEGNDDLERLYNAFRYVSVYDGHIQHRKDLTNLVTTTLLSQIQPLLEQIDKINKLDTKSDIIDILYLDWFYSLICSQATKVITSILHETDKAYLRDFIDFIDSRYKKHLAEKLPTFKQLLTNLMPEGKREFEDFKNNFFLLEILRNWNPGEVDVFEQWFCDNLQLFYEKFPKLQHKVLPRCKTYRLAGVAKKTVGAS